MNCLCGTKQENINQGFQIYENDFMSDPKEAAFDSYSKSSHLEKTEDNIFDSLLKLSCINLRELIKETTNQLSNDHSIDKSKN